MSFLHRVTNIGVKEEHTLYQKKIRRFFNTINLVGIISAFLQVVVFYDVDIISCYYHLSWAGLIFVAMVLHHYIGFNIARFVTFSSILLFGFLHALRFGPEAYAHLGSVTVIVACFIVYDLKKEWPYLLYFLTFLITGIVLVESDLYTNHDIVFENMAQTRILALIFMIIFILVETVFFIRLSSNNETEIIAELKESNLILKNTNKEKSILLKEVHHRVKNNLQLVSSLLRLQANTVNDPKLSEHFVDATNRIKSIALLHEKVYRNDSLAEINLKEYIHSIGSDMISSHSLEKNIELIVNSVIEKVDNDSIVPFALIFNELVSNSLKHGLKDLQEAKISVEVKALDDSKFELVYKDGGTWIEPFSKNSFGLELIETLAEQLNGEFNMDLTENSPRFSVTFKLST